MDIQSRRKNIMVNENQEPEYNNNNVLGVIGGLLIGSLAGAVAMWLLAPQSGKRTRMQIQQKSIELRDQTSDMLEDAMTQVRLDGKKITREGRQKAKALLQQGQELVTEQLEHVSAAVKSGTKAIQGSQG
jgi:gas vesicle protein